MSVRRGGEVVSKVVGAHDASPGKDQDGVGSSGSRCDRATYKTSSKVDEIGTRDEVATDFR